MDTTHIHDKDHFSYGLTVELQDLLDHALEQENKENLALIFGEYHYADIADYISTTSSEYRKKLIELSADYLNPNLLVVMNDSIRQQVIDLVGCERAAELISELEIDDVVYICENTDAHTYKNLLELFPESQQIAITERLNYPEDSAGRIMKQKMVTIMQYWTVSQAIEYLRHHLDLPEQFYEIFVLDHKHKLIGSIDCNQLVCSKPNSLITDIIEHDIKMVTTDIDQEEVSFMFKQYGLSSVPVINKAGRLVGVISVEDIVEVVDKVNEEDIMKMAGVGNSSDIHSTFYEASFKRLPWLIINFVTAVLTSHIISKFGATIEQMVVLAAIMPIIASMGGNAGTQTVTIVIRALAVRDLVDANTLRVILKEILTCALNGITLAVIGGTIVYLIYNNLMLSGVFAGALVANLVVAGAMGSIIPVTLNKIGIDPAISSSIFLTATTDIIGFWLFLMLATMLLSGG